VCIEGAGLEVGGGLSNGAGGHGFEPASDQLAALIVQFLGMRPCCNDTDMKLITIII